MKVWLRSLVQVAVLLGVTAMLTAVTYWIKGEPQRYVEEVQPAQGVPVTIPDGFISTEQIFSLYQGKVLWVDARSRSQWKSDGVVGAVFISSDPREDLNSLVENAAATLFQAEGDKTPIVVYCSNKGCSDSKLVAKSIRELELDTPVFQLFGGFGALLREKRIVRLND